MIKINRFRTVAIIALSLLLMMCSKTKNPVMGPAEDLKDFNFESLQSNCKENSIKSISEIAVESLQGECKSGLYQGPLDASADTLEDSVLVWFSDNKVWVMHKNAFENCCSVILTEVVSTPQGFDVFEHDTATNLCFCLCYFDIVTTIHDVSPGVYLIRVFDTAGSFVGEDALVVPSQGDTVIFSSYADTISVIHQDAFYNCCSEIVVDVEQNDGRFDLFEWDTSEEACFCMCDFDITTIISGVSEGSYPVRLFDIYGNLVDSAVVSVSPY